MKKLINKINSKATELAIRTKTALASKSGEGYIDTAVKIIIGVVVGGVILVGLYALFDNVVLPTLETKIQGMFNYTAESQTKSSNEKRGILAPGNVHDSMMFDDVYNNTVSFFLEVETVVADSAYRTP